MQILSYLHVAGRRSVVRTRCPLAPHLPGSCRLLSAQLLLIPPSHSRRARCNSKAVAMSSSYSSLADWNKEPRPSSSHLHRTPKAVAQQHPQFHDDDAPGVHPSSDVFAKQYAISKGSYDEFSASHNSRPKPTTNPASPIEEDSDNDCDRVNSMLMLTSPDRLSVTATPTVCALVPRRNAINASKRVFDSCQDGESSFHQEQSGWNASHAMSVRLLSS